MSPPTGRSLHQALGEAGVSADSFDLPLVWPALAAYFQLFAGDGTSEQHRCVLLLSRVPAGADLGVYFAGEPPSPLHGRALMCLELSLNFAPAEEVGVTLWFAMHAGWEALRDEPGWIDLGPSTPHLEWAYRISDVSQFKHDFEQSTVYAIASREKALAIGIGDGDTEEVTYLRPA